MSLLEMSASGAIMILVIVILRALAINRLPKRTFLTLWGLALLRLLLPFQIPSPLSVYSFASCFSKGNILPEQVSKNNLTFTIPSESSAALAAPFLPEQATFFVLPWTIVWLMGMLVCALFFTISYCKCYREFQTSLPFHDARTQKWLCEHKRLRTIEIRQSDRIWTPLTYGIVHPVILLPKNME